MSALQPAQAAAWLACHAAIIERARELAATGHGVDDSADLLRREFPGLPDPYYLNHASMATMGRLRRDQQAEEGQCADRARLRRKGLPESWAGTSSDQRAAAAGSAFVGDLEY